MEWLAGNRIRGTTAERPALGLPSGSVGGWKELGRTTLGSSNANISVASLPDKRYYMVLGHNIGNSGATDYNMRLNSDTGTNYARRQSINGGSDSAIGSLNRMNIHSGNTAMPQFSVGYLANKSDKEKLHISHYVGSTTGAGNAPGRSENVNKWANTSSAIDEVTLLAFDGGTFGTGSEAVVLGWDPADTHTTNFWEELGSADLSGGTADNLDITSFDAKKYLWVQFYVKSVTGVTRPTLRFNSDTGSNYSNRESYNGGTDTTNTSVDKAYITSTDIPVGSGYFGDMFIINNSANEKLVIQHGVYGNTAGAGTAPLRVESVAKWANTSDQITSVQIINDRASADFNTISSMKVWGSD